MKKSLCFVLSVLLAFTLAAPAAAVEMAPEEAVSLSSPCAILMERSTGTVLYEKNAHERGAPASVTKVMTMLLIVEAVDSGSLSLDDYVTGSANAASMGGSQIWLEEGERMTVSEMLKCIAVVSANDCAVAMAEHIAGSEENFVQKMNRRAADLGLEDTQFTNCTGLYDDPEHYTTAYDLAVMSRELLSHAWIKEYTTIWMDSIRDGAFGLSNTNKLVHSYDGCTGLKTGYTSRAMYCLAASAEREGVEYIAVIMHGESIEKRNNDAKALLSFGFSNYALTPLRAADALPPIRIELGEADSIQPEYEGPDSLLMEKGSAKDISYNLDLPESLTAPVAHGQRIGTLSVYSAGQLLSEVPIVAGCGVDRLSVGAIFRMLLTSGLSGD